MDYFPFGSLRVDERYSNFDETKKFTGHELDDESNLYYAKARYYDPEIGRFISQDPLQGRPFELMKKFGALPQALNYYSYALNNPIVIVDPSGENPALGYILEFLALFGFEPVAKAHAPNIGENTGVPEDQYSPSLAQTALNDGSRYLSETGHDQVAKAVMFMAGATETVNDVRKAKGLVNLTSDGLVHMIRRHTSYGSESRNRSIFNDDVNLLKLLRNRDYSEVKTLESGKKIYTFDAGENIGVDYKSQKQTSIYTIISDKDGNLDTAHPGLNSPIRENVIHSEKRK